MRTSRIVLAGAVLLIPAAVHGAEEIRGNAVRVAGMGAQASMLIVHLERYSTDEERARWRQAFAAGGQEALVKIWQDEEPEVGTCAFEQRLGYRLRAALSIPTETGRRILLATDRPIAGFEVLGGRRSQDYPIGWIQVDVDAEGKGEGHLVAMAQFAVEDNRLVMTTYGTEPVRLVNVVVREKKSQDD